MAKRKPVENPFAIVNQISRLKVTETTEFVGEQSFGKVSKKVDQTKSNCTIQIDCYLAEQFDIVAADLRELLPEEVRGEFENGILNELGIAYLLSDYYAHEQGESVAARLACGWAKAVVAEKD